jgi:hypothetical protein
MKEEMLSIASDLREGHITSNEAKRLLLGLFGVGDVEILIKGLEHIGKWGDEEEERWDDPGDCAMDTLTQYRYSISIR